MAAAKALPITDKRSKAYKESQKKLKNKAKPVVTEGITLRDNIKWTPELVDTFNEMVVSADGVRNDIVDWGGENNKKNLYTVCKNLATITEQLFQNADKITAKVNDITGDASGMRKEEDSESQLASCIIDQLVNRTNRLVALNVYLKEQVIKLESIVG